MIQRLVLTIGEKMIHYSINLKQNRTLKNYTSLFKKFSGSHGEFLPSNGIIFAFWLNRNDFG